MYDNGQLLLEDDVDLDIEDLDDDDFDEFLNYLEEGDFDENDLDERRRRGRRRPSRGRRSRLPSRRLQKRPSSAQSALRAAINKNSQTIKKVDTKINSVNGKVGALRNDQKRLMVTLKKDRIARKKEMEELKSKLQLFALLPLLTGGGSGGASGILPLLLLGDLGGSNSKGGSDMSSLFLVLALSGGLGGGLGGSTT